MWYVFFLWRPDGSLRPSMRAMHRDTLTEAIDAARRWLQISQRGGVPSNLKYERWTISAASLQGPGDRFATGGLDDRIEYRN